MGVLRPFRRPAAEDELRARAKELAGSGSPAAALALLTAAAEDVERDDPDAAAGLLAEASWYARIGYGPADALPIARRATELVTGADARAELVVRSRLGDALQWNGQYAEARAEWLHAAAVAVPPAPHLLAARANAFLRAGELVAARRAAYAAAARAREANDGAALRDALTFQAVTEVHVGLLREADASAQELEAAAGGGDSGDRLEALGVRAWIDALLHDEATCRARVAAAYAVAHELRITPGQGMATGLLALRLGRHEEAVEQFELKLADMTPVAAALALRPFLDGLVEACARSGREERAAELVDNALDATTGQPRYVAIAFRMRALARRDLDDLRRALEQHRPWGNRFEEARTRLVLGEALRRERRRGEAREQLSAATAAFAAVGAAAWAGRARDELRATGARLPRAASGAALTAQESRVARMVADGLSNKEIAARLVVSPKTVEGHLRNIFEKLGVSSRTQMARTLLRPRS